MCVCAFACVLLSMYLDISLGCTLDNSDVDVEYRRARIRIHKYTEP